MITEYPLVSFSYLLSLQLISEESIKLKLETTTEM